MLLKFPCNTFIRSVTDSVRKGAFVVCLLATSNLAVGNEEQDIQLHGFVAQGLIDVDGSNYVNNDEKPSAELTELGFNASYQYSDNLRFSGQAVYLNGGNRYVEGFHIDYLLMDWSAFTNDKWQVNLYLGRIKNYHWLYSSTRDVPMTRPSIILPQSVYFDATRNMSVGGDGGALTAKYFSDDLGDFDFRISSSYSNISDEQAKIILGPMSNGDLAHKADFQSSVYWAPLGTNWRLGLAMTDATFQYEKERESAFTDGDLALTRHYLNGEYQGDNWTFSFELLQEKMKLEGFMSDTFIQEKTGQGGFAQLEYIYGTNVKLLGRLEHYYADKDDKTGTHLAETTNGFVPKHFGYQHEAVIGATIDITTNVQIQLEHHWVKGTARLTPVVLPNPLVNNHEYWQISAIQIVYWF
ncbi:hypothetical protein [Thalassotalea hakodatensis]|uniref:hypothetical protein n=1 Tax=Thalassotalea hakodatensis TaxID=3030492 RepID=UPI0025744289|nr:hypothetical protein [Thalassotalea hakodatensis]